jgi:hypothetical protein
VTDRDQNYDTKHDAPVAGATLYPTEQCSSCSVSLMGLSNDWTKLNTKIDAMTPVGTPTSGAGGGDPIPTLLQNCASSTDKSYLLTSADQMTATFNTIGANLTKLRVAQ